MPKITFPDGRIENFKKNVTGNLIAQSISKSLSKKAIAIIVDGVQKDLCDYIDQDASISIITINSPEGLEIKTYFIARKAVKLIPKLKVSYIPTIENVFTVFLTNLYHQMIYQKLKMK